jgi:LPS sulfotransferase NodH
MSAAAAVRFAIFAAPRTGSNLLCSLLNSHAGILCHHGLFNPGGIHYALDHRDGRVSFGTVDERDRAPLAFLEKVWSYSGGKGAVGFKFNSGENETAARAVVDDRAVRKILLSRRNRIKTYVSEQIAEETGRWENYGDAPPEPLHPVRVEPEALFEHIERNERYYAALRHALGTTAQSWLEVHYESFGANEPDGDVARVLAFLGAPAGEPLRPASRKRSPDDLRVLVSNFETLEAALSGTALEGELHGAPIPSHRAY